MAALDVLLPVKNGMPYIEGAIESILQQTFGDFTLFVIDDGSSDETATVVANFAHGDSRLRLIDFNGDGLIDALNRGLELSTSPFVARMDADDISMPTRFERQLSYLQTHPDVVVVGCWTRHIDQGGELLNTTTKYPTSPNDLERQLFSNKNPLAHPTVMMRSDKVKALGGYRKPLKAAEDFDLWLRVAEAGKLANLPEPLLRYRIHPGQVSAAQRLTQSFASELAFICSEERRANRIDPVKGLSGTVSWSERAFLGDVPAIMDLCDRFAAIKDVFQATPCDKDLLYSALAQIAKFHLSMSINHRLYADVSAKIAVQALRNHAPKIALRAFFIGLSKNIGRFLKTAKQNFSDHYSII